MTLNIYLFISYCYLLIAMSEVQSLTDRNIYCECSSCPTDQCLLQIGGQCFSSLDNEYDYETKQMEVIPATGCFSKNAELQCYADLITTYYGRSIKCCNHSDFCNIYLKPEITKFIFHPPNSNPRPNEIEASTIQNYLLYVIIFVTILAIIVPLFVLCCCIRMKKSRGIEHENCVFEENNVGFVAANRNFSSSDPAQGKPFMEQITIGKKFIRLRCLSKNIKSVQLNVGKLNGTEVVEKVFPTHEEHLWKTETSIYETALLRHNNVLGYIGSDILGSGMRTIYTDYHPLGSLRSYLTNNRLSGEEFLVLVKSAAAGLEHLHTEIMGIEKRPAIAHRNITSNNIVVNRYKECVLTNFENALMHMNGNEPFDGPDNIHVGSPRYMAPEIIKASINVNSFDEFKKADVFSLGLIFYEICQRCTLVNDELTCEEYSLPFDKYLPLTPTLEDMKKLTTTGKIENLIIPMDRWLSDETLLKVFWKDVLKECIRDIPSSRSTVFRIRKKIESIMNAANHDNV